MYIDKKKINALLQWYTKEIGEDLIAALIVDREGLLIEILTKSSDKAEEEKFIGAFSALVELVLKKITKDFDLGTFGAGTFDTDQYRFIFCEAGPELVFVTVLDALSMVDPYFAYAYLAAEKIARIFDGRSVSPVIPKIIIDRNIQNIERKIFTLQKISIPSSDYIYKLILCGDGNVGKTSMVHRFVEDIFQADYKATIGTSIIKKECIFEGLNSSVRFVIWDLAGQPQFRRMRSTYLANSAAAVLVFDLTNRDTFENLKNWHDEIMKMAPPDIFLILVGNKIDLEDSRVVSTAEGMTIAKDFGVSYIETSAKTGENINDAFKMLALQLIHRFVEAEEVYKIITERSPQFSEIEKENETSEEDIKYEKIPIREIWEKKDIHFTPWLESHIEALNDALNLSLKPITNRKETRSFNIDIDILAKDEAGNNVIIQNQYNKSGHEYLGNILSCLAYYNAKLAIWICEEVLPEHEEAINWLNENTPDGVFFYLIKIEVVKVKNFRPIPKFILVCGPSEEKIKKKMEFNGTLNYSEQKRIKFWEKLINKINSNFSIHSDIKILNKPWISKSAGKKGLDYTYIIKDDWSAIELYFDHQDGLINRKRFKELEKKKDEIKKEFADISWHLSDELDWNYDETRNYQSIRYRFDNGGLKNEKKWDEIQYSMIDAMKCLVTCLQKHVDNLV